jgi:septum formation protein
MEIILASKSPRRRELLGSLGVEFKIIPAVGDEVLVEGLTPGEIAKSIAGAKADEIFAKYPDSAVIGADTIVVLDGEILQKPKDNDDEYNMLTKLSGREHTVFTGYALLTKERKVYGVEGSTVVFNDLSEQTKLAYVESGLGLDKAGGYGIQDGYDLVKEIKGSYNNIVGFPTEVFEKLLKEFNLK